MLLPDELDKKTVSIYFANHQLVFSGLSALFWPEQQLIIIADLHLEKGSYYAQRGNPLPLYDTWDTLIRLKRLIDLYQPKTILSLGDNIHDSKAFLRMNPQTQQLLEEMTQQVNEWIWLMGNHDREVIPVFKSNIRFYHHLKIGNITFSHDFLANTPHQIVGHYHPKVTVKKISGKCFLFNADKIILPSFGSYTGGLDIDSLNFKKVTQNEAFQAFLLNKEKVWRVK